MQFLYIFNEAYLKNFSKIVDIVKIGCWVSSQIRSFAADRTADSGVSVTQLDVSVALSLWIPSKGVELMCGCEGSLTFIQATGVY